jgi:hypothetical protein
MPPRLATLLITLTFVVLSLTGILAFVRAFSIQLVGLHALMGFVFIAFVGFHVTNNFWSLKNHLRSPALWASLAITTALSLLFWWQPAPVKALLGLSGNLGPAQDRFELSEDGLVYQYSPIPEYKMALTIKTAKGYDPDHPPEVAIWLENQGAYHIKTLRGPETSDTDHLPYWSFKRRGWENAKREAAEGLETEAEDVDGISGATPNGSFDPADYILPADPENPMPYKLLIEINQPGDAHGKYTDQPSLVYAVEIDNALPRTFQLLDIVGYPQREDVEGKEAWALYYVDDSFGSALDLIDSALLTIERGDL